jgi:hypothetical protein
MRIEDCCMANIIEEINGGVVTILVKSKAFPVTGHRGL